ncbi:MAG: aminotransferase class IV [Comamonadaceae bacterium]|nr:aminotransferase class IV [Comamonadaceae bacterium]
MAPTVFIMTEPLVDAAGRAAARPASRAITAAGLPLAALRPQDRLAARQRACCASRRSTRAAPRRMLFRDGFLTEGAASNIFVVKDGVLLAPPKSHLMLPGITYDVVLELARHARHAASRCARSLEAEVRAADEVWMTSSTKEVLPITHAGRPAGRQRPARALLGDGCTQLVSGLQERRSCAQG